MTHRLARSIHVIEPIAKHTHTAILLHGRGDSGPDFAEEILSSGLSERSDSTLLTQFPSWRWVFPSAPSRWSTAFQEELFAWFEAHSLSDITSREDLQVEGIRESVADIITILDEEVARLEGVTENVVLGGISQGAAVGLRALLYQFRAERKFGGFVGASCWLPFSSVIESLLSKAEQPGRDLGSLTISSEGFEKSMLEAIRTSLTSHGKNNPLLSTPVFLGHGIDDAYVDIGLGRQVRDVLSGIGFHVTWKEYVGSEQEGHWFKEPEEIDDIARFLMTIRVIESSLP